MFGPDICGTSKTTPFILYSGGQKLECKTRIYPATDQLTHFYTLIIRANGTFFAGIDGVEQASGDLLEAFELPPQFILDEDAQKPRDWVDEELIPDPADTKPEGWIDEEFLPDPESILFL